MKVLVFAHEFHVGGTQVNTIDLTAALRDRYGWDVLVFAKPGPMVRLLEERSLRFLPAPNGLILRMRELRRLVRHERPDIIHVWDWPQCLDAYFAVHLTMRVPMVVTDMSMTLQRLLPKALPTTFGTPELVDQARATGRRPVELIVPPVDLQRNAPGAVETRQFRKQYRISDREITIVTVSRLVEWMKAESLRRTVDVIRILGSELPVRFLIVGDGTSREELQQLADRTNATLGRGAVTLTGALLDPRPAYASADIVVGMGGSALRGMAFGKPVVIVGEQGFSATFSPETQDVFYYKGIYGFGDGVDTNDRLAASIRALAERPSELRALGDFSRQFVLKNFSLEIVSARLAKFLRASAAESPKLRVTAEDAFRTAAILVGGKLLSKSLRSRVVSWKTRTHNHTAARQVKLKGLGVD